MSTKSILEGMVEKWGDVDSIKDMAKTLDSERLRTWIECCIENASKNKNYAFLLQELVNVLGSKLGFEVSGNWKEKGPDGVWKFGDSQIVVETKASSFYFNFGTIANYVKSYKAASAIAVSSEFSDDKIAAVKGGYAANIRLITTDSLLKLAKLKEKDVISTESVVDLLIPQETIKLDGLIEVIHGIFETRMETKPGEEEEEKDKLDIDDVPEDIEDLGEVSRAMYIILKKNPDRTFESWELTEEINDNFAWTFSEVNPGLGLVWSGDALKKRGRIIIERYRPNPKEAPKWYKRRYKIKK